MKAPQCAVCGRAVEGTADARQDGKHWFCSQSHFLEWETRPNSRRGRRRTGIAAGLTPLVLSVAFIVWLTVSAHNGPTPFGQQNILGDALTQIGNAAKHPVVYRTQLTPAADKVATAFVDAEYVTHDCQALSHLTRRLPELKVVNGPIGEPDCANYLENDRQNDSHLVSGSRVVKHSCGPVFGLPLKTNECLQYATEGRYVTQDDGTRLHECNGSFTDVFLKRLGGRWFVVGETDTDDWGGSCQARDVRYWQRRLPWRS